MIGFTLRIHGNDGSRGLAHKPKDEDKEAEQERAEECEHEELIDLGAGERHRIDTPSGIGIGLELLIIIDFKDRVVEKKPSVVWMLGWKLVVCAARRFGTTVARHVGHGGINMGRRADRGAGIYI